MFRRVSQRSVHGLRSLPILARPQLAWPLQRAANIGFFFQKNPMICVLGVCGAIFDITTSSAISCIQSHITWNSGRCYSFFVPDSAFIVLPSVYFRHPAEVREASARQWGFGWVGWFNAVPHEVSFAAASLTPNLAHLAVALRLK